MNILSHGKTNIYYPSQIEVIKSLTKAKTFWRKAALSPPNATFCFKSVINVETEYTKVYPPSNPRKNKSEFSLREQCINREKEGNLEKITQAFLLRPLEPSALHHQKDMGHTCSQLLCLNELGFSKKWHNDLAW